MSPHRNWDSPNPSPASECALPPPPPDQRVGGGAHSPGAKGVGESKFRLCLLCALYLERSSEKHITDHIRMREEACQMACRSIEDVLENLQMHLTIEGLHR
jgi:hypothetical protein